MSFLFEVAHLLGRSRFRISTELALQDSLERVLERNFPTALRFREFNLTAKGKPLGRIDFRINRIGIECKSFSANARETHAQLYRYSQAEEIDGLILLTVRPMQISALECHLVIIEAGKSI